MVDTEQQQQQQQRSLKQRTQESPHFSTAEIVAAKKSRFGISNMEMLADRKISE